MAREGSRIIVGTVLTPLNVAIVPQSQIREEDLAVVQYCCIYAHARWCCFLRTGVLLLPKNYLVVPN